MSRVIAGVYEIEREIGSGGGGVVFLAKHQRLNKLVVLKGDKRSLTAKQDSLRREVDSLKNLSHSYIPQVYDYVSDGDTVYTVMDYVDGDSFDKLLSEDGRFEQARVVTWARQLLEAVAYLHQQPPHGILHADIKPANIMLTPQGDIRLIDFNIALYLGEDGAIAVGQSFGYASPEHYGIDNTNGTAAKSTTASNLEFEDSDTKAATESDVRTVVDSLSSVTPPSSESSGKKRLIDARSDIYGVGATLFHILTGVRPKREATEVEPILRQLCSAALASIVEKAMDPNPDLRYQSAEEMLRDIVNIRDNDPRVLRWKRARATASIALTLAFVVGGLFAFSGARLAERAQRSEAEAHRIEAEAQRAEASAERTIAEAERLEAELQRREARVLEMRVLAADSADALRSGDRYGAIALALDAVPNENDQDIPHSAEAKKALADALGVYDLSDGFKPHRTVALASEAIALAISPDGSTFAAMSLGRLSLFETESGFLLAELPAMESGLADVIYVSNSAILYAGYDGLTMYDLAEKSVKWVGGAATAIAVSADGGTVAAVDRSDSTAKLYAISGETRDDIDFGGRMMWVAANDRLGNPGGNILALNHDASLLAVSFSNGGLEIFDLTGNQQGIELFDESEYSYFEGGFHGKYFAFSATNSEESLFAVIDTERLIQTVSTILPEHIGVSADGDGVYMSLNGINVSIDPETAEQTLLAHDPREHLAGGYLVDASLNSPIVRISKFQSHTDKGVFAYDRSFAHDEARLNADGDRLMLFSFSLFRVLDISGNLINETPVPDAGQVYDQQYRRNGGGEPYLEVTYYNGTVHRYSGIDGALIAEYTIPPPDKSLDEVFATDCLLITSPLHGTPCAYDIATGDLVRELEKDAYLSYVTQVGECVITEYISAFGDRYGMLLDGRTGEALAYIPHLSDIIGDRLVADIRSSGSMRGFRLFSTEELIEIARTELNTAR